MPSSSEKNSSPTYSNEVMLLLWVHAIEAQHSKQSSMSWCIFVIVYFYTMLLLLLLPWFIQWTQNCLTLAWLFGNYTLLFCWLSSYIKNDFFFRTFAPDFHSIFIFINSPSLPFSAAVEAFCSLSHFNVIWQQPQTKSILRAFHYALLRTLKCDKLWFFLCNFAHNFNLLFLCFF